METFEQKQNQILAKFASCSSKEERYQLLMKLGRSCGCLPIEDQTSGNLVLGCQSVMYLKSWIEDGRVYFQAMSEALISAGLAAVLIEVYSGETPETVLKRTPDYLDELQISASLSANRSNGLYNIHLKMKQQALQYLIYTQDDSSFGLNG